MSTSVKEESKKVGLPSFRKKTSKSGGKAVASAVDGVVKKNKLHHIRGLLTGESRRERKAKKEADRAAAIAAGITPPVTQSVIDEDEDDETIYGVSNVETDSLTIGTPPGVSPLKTDSAAESDVEAEPDLVPGDDDSIGRAIQVILLLMDPKTRRFELLQLEFDSNKAVVRDVLSQVPHSVTEEALRKQNYTGVCDRTGQELYYSTRLSDVCTGSDILIALPSSVDARECARLAKPILQDRNVIEMLRSSGVDTTSLERKESAPNSPVRKDAPPASAAKAAPSSPMVEKKKIEKKKGGSKSTLFIVLLVAVAILIQVVHMSVTAPLNPGHSLSPNAFMSKCGYKAWLPSCEEASMVMNEDGVLALYGANGSIEWEMLGKTCTSVDDKNCRNGLFINADGSLVIGGKNINAAAIYGEAMFTPWPFTESPKVRLVRGKK